MKTIHKQILGVPLLLFLLLASGKESRAQQIAISPTSLKAWGSTPGVIKASVSYQTIEAVILYASRRMYDHSGDIMAGYYTGLFWNPISFQTGPVAWSGGPGYFLRRYPTTNGTHLHFSAELSYPLTSMISLQYGHISNGFGLTNPVNPGVDNIAIVINFK